MMLTIILIITLLSKEIESVNDFLHVRRLQDGQFPYLVQFQTISACGGVLVKPDWVLTAAQCVMVKRSAIFLHLAGSSGEKLQPIGVKVTYIHPSYNFYSPSPDYEHNIALLKLSDSYEISKNSQPFLIDPPKLNDNYETCLIFGWQSTVSPNSRVFAKPVQYTNVLPSAWKICTYSQGIYRAISTRENIFCAMIESRDGLKACAGNPGTPIICKNQYDRNILLGIASWTNYSLDCNGLPAYLSVAPFSSWIHKLVLTSERYNSTVNHESKTRMRSFREDPNGSEDIKMNEGETFGASNDYKSLENAFRNIHDDSFYYISASKFSILEFRISLWLLYCQLFIYFVI